MSLLKDIGNRFSMIIKAVFFDLDDTLYDKDDYVLKTYSYICEKMGLGDDVKSYMCSEYLRHGEDGIFQKTVGYYNLEIELIKKMVYYYHHSTVGIELYDDFVEFLSDLHNFKKAIITNGGKKTQSNKIKLLDLSKKVDDIVISGEHFDKTKWKPNKTVFLYAARRLDVLPSECIYVGDKLEIDVCGAINAGMVPVLIDRQNRNDFVEKKYNSNRFFVINTLTNLKMVLDAIR